MCFLSFNILECFFVTFFRKVDSNLNGNDISSALQRSRSFISLQLLTTAECELMPYGTPLPQYLKCAYVVSLNTPARVIQDQLAVIYLAGQALPDGLHAWA